MMRSTIVQHLTYANVISTLCLFLLLSGGAAFAASQLGKNSVGPKQLKKNAVTSKAIKNGQVKSIDVANEGLTGADILNGTVSGIEIGDGVVTGAKIAPAGVAGANLADAAVTSSKIADGTVGAADLDPNTVGDIISTGGTFPNDGVQRPILAVPGFGTFKGGCSGADTVNVFYELEKNLVKQNARIFAHDPFDEKPKGAAAVTSEKGGGVGFGGSESLATHGEIFAFTDDRVLVIDFTLVPGCVYRIRATLDHNET
jgi:hypothetical protein